MQPAHFTTPHSILLQGHTGKYINRLCRVTSLPALFACACVSLPAIAHPDYERAYKEIELPRIGRVTMAKSYTDGIFVADPVKLVIRDTKGNTIAETDYADDLAVVCVPGKECVVYEYQANWLFAPSRIWQTYEGKLTHEDSPWLWAFGVFALFLEHWVGYVLATLCFLAPSIVGTAKPRRNPGKLRTVGYVLATVLSVLAFLVALFVAIYDLSFPILAFMVTVLWLLLRKFSTKHDAPLSHT